MGLKYREPTSVRLVLEFLRKNDDMYTARMIALSTGVTVNRVHAALYMLRDYKCVEIVGADMKGINWWCALPPEQDTRLRYLIERTPESKKRRPKKNKIQKKLD